MLLSPVVTTVTARATYTNPRLIAIITARTAPIHLDRGKELCQQGIGPVVSVIRKGPKVRPASRPL